VSHYPNTCMSSRARLHEVLHCPIVVLAESNMIVNSLQSRRPDMFWVVALWQITSGGISSDRARKIHKVG